MADRRTNVWLAAGLAVVAMGLAWAAIAGVGRHARPNTAKTTQVASTGYADSAECASCHADIAATYGKTGMGRSFSTASGQNVVEDYAKRNTIHHPASGTEYAMVERDGALFQRRSQRGFEGKEENVMEARVDYVIGSGNHSRSYLHRAPDGQLIELPVSWYSERGGYWAMSPGYDWKGQKDFGRAITPECMFCHNGYPNGDVGLERSLFPAKLPEGVDCQRCHGPGQAHVEAARSGHASEEQVRSTIVNPGHLGRERQMEVCLQCHLETSRHEPNEQRISGRGIFSYRPGEPMADYALYFEPVDRGQDDAFEIAHAAYRLRMSACFRGSQMTCLTCHDPHDIPRGDAAVAHYTEVCLNCHRGVKHTVTLTPGSTCLSCHMPKRRTEDAVHVAMTDHFIRRVQPRRDLLAPIAETQLPEGSVTRVALYYPAKAPGTPAAAIAIAEAQVNDAGIARLQGLLERYQPDAPEPYVALANAYERAGNEAEVARWSEAALAKRKNFRPAVVLLVPALFAGHQDAEATQVLDEAVTRYPEDDLLLSDLGNAYLRHGDLAKASEVLERALKANPDRPETHRLLGVIALKQGDLAGGERELREALRCQPQFAEAHDDLGGALVEQHKYPEAAFHFERAIAANAEFGEAHRHLGRVLVLMDQVGRALEELREAVRINPEKIEAREDLADVLAASGHREAADEYERVLKLRPHYPQAELGLGTALLSRHEGAEARIHLEFAAQGADAETSLAARLLLEQLSR